MIRAPLPILAGQVIVQTLEINEAGDLFSSLSLLSIVVFVGTLGLDRVFYHELGRAKVSGELAVARGMRRAAPIIMMLVSGICIVDNIRRAWCSSCNRAMAWRRWAHELISLHIR